MMSRTALREDPRIAPQANDRTYHLSTGLHTYGVSYPAGLRRLELVSAGTQTAFQLYETTPRGVGEKARSCMAFVCEEE